MESWALRNVTRLDGGDGWQGWCFVSMVVVLGRLEAIRLLAGVLVAGGLLAYWLVAGRLITGVFFKAHKKGYTLKNGSLKFKEETKSIFFSSILNVWVSKYMGFSSYHQLIKKSH